jgi:hypothetical protein
MAVHRRGAPHATHWLVIAAKGAGRKSANDQYNCKDYKTLNHFALCSREGSFHGWSPVATRPGWNR